MSKIIIAIDPGSHGAIAVLNDGRLAGTMDYDNKEFFSLLVENPGAVVVIESVHASPAQGAANAFAFGFYSGMPVAILSALGIEYSTITPQNWQKTLGLISKTKAQAKEMAEDIFCRKFKRHDHAEAALIAVVTYATLNTRVSA